MTKLIKTTLIVTMLGFATLQGHGGGHTHDTPVEKEISKKSIKSIAKQEVKRLALAKKIDNSWLFSPISKMQKTNYNYNNEWTVSFSNAEIKDKTKQTLYIFVTVGGELTGANYTGK